HDWRIARRRWRVRKDLGPRTRRLASDIEQVLDSDNCSVERTECYASVCSSIRRIGSGPSGLGIDSKAGTLTFPLGIGYASKSLFQPVTSGAYCTGCLYLCANNAGRNSCRCGDTCKMQNLTPSNFLHPSTPLFRIWRDLGIESVSPLWCSRKR